MLNRVYIDNFRCFVNFELALEAQQLILGLNGSGKSTLLEVLRALKELVTGVSQLGVLFPETTRTRWQTLSQQTFELHVQLEASYRFKLELDSWDRPPRTRIKRECVWCDEKPIFEFADGEVHLFNDRFEHKVTYPFDWFRSALATVQERPENTKLMRFKEWIENLHCLQLNPRTMSDRTEKEESDPAPDMSNFASWYRHMTQERADAASKLQEYLRGVIPGFESLDLRSSGANLRTLAVRIAASGNGNQNRFALSFDELSEGQRVLVCLYAILNFAISRGSCVFLDEPENYIAIPEIQPWLMELRDRVEENGGQISLLSHHPEVINYLAPELGLVFERAGAGPVRVRKFVSAPDDSLTPSERIARGWLTYG
jgi:predicted ATPase